MPKCFFVILFSFLLNYPSGQTCAQVFSVPIPEYTVSYYDYFPNYKKRYALKNEKDEFRSGAVNRKLKYFLSGILIVLFIIAIVIYASGRSKRKK